MTVRAMMIAGLTCLAGAGAAQTVFTPPQGCTGTLTIQSRACLVTNVWTCDADAPGEQWVALFTQDGPMQVRRVDPEFQWLETYYANPPAVETMVQPAPDPESLTELFATKYDTYDFTVTTNDGAPAARYVGFDRLTGETVTIDGETLFRTEFGYDVMTETGEVLYTREGRQFVSDTHRLFFLGLSWDKSTPDLVEDASPVEFIYPGETGFFSPDPKFDCGVVMSSFPVPE